MRTLMLTASLFCIHFTSAQLKRYSIQQLTADVHYLARTVEAVHPNPYHAISRNDFYALRDATIASFYDSMSAIDAWPKIAALLASLNEGHSDLRLPAEYGEVLSTGGVLLFPIAIKKQVPGGLLVRADLSGDSVLQAGDTLTAINGIAVNEVIRKMFSVVGGLPGWKAQQVIPDFIGQLYLQGIRSPYTITFKRENQITTKPLRGLTLGELQANAAALKRAPSTKVQGPYTFTRIESQVGYLNFTTMGVPLEPFENFLKETFHDIKEKGLQGLIIDLRENGGGNSNLGLALLQYITDKPFRMAGGSTWKVSQPYKDFIHAKGQDTGQAGLHMAHYLKKENGTLIEAKQKGYYKPGKNPLRYSGPVVVLIGPRTFSSANMTANAIQDFKLATLIGEPSGEPANDYGELYQGQLPNTGIPFVTSTKMFIRANGDVNDKNPVLPDIHVEQNDTAGKDNVLEYAIRYLKTRSGQ